MKLQSTAKAIASVILICGASIFFSCSSDDGDDNNSSGGGTEGLSGLHTQPAQQVYLSNGETYNKSSDVVMVFNKSRFAYIDYCNSDGCICGDKNGNSVECTEEEYEQYDIIKAGKIENGKITLDLPKSIDSKYLYPFGDEKKGKGVEDICEGANNPCINEIKNTLVADIEFYTEDYCILHIHGIEDYEEFSGIIYSQEAGILKYEEAYQTIDYNFSKGWNIFYHRYEEGIDYYSSDKDIIKGTLKWKIYCEDY